MLHATRGQGADTEGGKAGQSSCEALACIYGVCAYPESQCLRIPATAVRNDADFFLTSSDFQMQPRTPEEGMVLHKTHISKNSAEPGLVNTPPLSSLPS